MRVVVTGSEGYIGSVLCPYLVERGHEVVGIDAGLYRSPLLYEDADMSVETHRRDIRRLEPADMEGADAIVHMAELSNDPVGQLAPEVTHDINHRGSLHVAETAKAAQVSRFVYTSSCSVYGVSDQELVDEGSPLSPQTAYAECKELVERDVAGMADDTFSPTFLRNATACGASPRIRFDVVLNNLCGLAWTTKDIRMESDGSPWRPIVHVRDICKAIACALDAPRDRVHNEVLNVGDTSSNYRIRELAEIVGAVFPDCSVSIAGRSPDSRSYRVSFEKIRELLPTFACSWNAERSAHELLDVFAKVELTEETFRSRPFTRLKQIEHLVETGQIDDAFFWTGVGSPYEQIASIDTHRAVRDRG